MLVLVFQAQVLVLDPNPASYWAFGTLNNIVNTQGYFNTKLVYLVYDIQKKREYIILAY